MNTELAGEGAQWSAQLQQLDESLALSRVGGDVELLKEVIELFLDDYPGHLRKNQECRGRERRQPFGAPRS